MRRLRHWLLGQPRLARLVDRWNRSRTRRLPRPATQMEDIEGVRILVGPSMGYGNAILFEPFIRKLRQVLVGRPIGLVGPPPYLQLFEGTGLFDSAEAVHTLAEWQPAPAAARIEAWQAEGVTTVAETYIPFLHHRVRRRLSHSFRHFWFPQTAWYPTPFRGVHETEELLRLLEEYLDIASDPSEHAPQLHLSDAEERQGRQLMDGRLDRPLVGFHLGSKGGSPAADAKRWPVEHFIALALRLQETYDVAIAVFGSSKTEAEVSALFCQAVPGAMDCTDLGSIRVTGAALSHCGLVVANDSGLMHLAAAAGTPVVAIFGPTHPAKNAPRTDAVRVVKLDLPCQPCFYTDHGPETCSHWNCTRTLTPQRVFEEARAFVEHCLHV